ncbi:MAG: 3-hydroxyacyl-CoA dehydrogenase [Deltaproteobacteria bacterium HGW-Deltaproteobacteria-19]|jgi:3-hydroxyacyl-CoA dehydrogenase|nr:MAG: 3-hydroxyacyl-CoA dehydrogenase [Deltaproteobacteria bacterium HGW-Deltaproteobacteria-19]
MVKVNEMKRAVVVGAGTMGHSIAQVFAQHGIETGLADTTGECLERAMRLIRVNLETLADYGSVKREEIPAILGRIIPSTDLAAAAEGADFAIEAVVEVPEVKKAVFQQLERICPDGAVLASNTSSLDVFSIVGEIHRPERLLITHWFAPPHIIPLVEVVPGPKTSPEAMDVAVQLMQRLGKKAVVLKQFVPSFIVNRIQQMIFFGVLEILKNDWASPEDIDLAVKASLGVRLPVVGAVQTLDFTGLDLVDTMIKNALGQSVPFIAEPVSKGHLGVKSSKGLYDYGGRSEEEILRKRDIRYLAVLEQMEKLGAFEPV